MEQRVLDLVAAALAAAERPGRLGIDPDRHALLAALNERLGDLRRLMAGVEPRAFDGDLRVALAWLKGRI